MSDAIRIGHLYPSQGMPIGVRKPAVSDNKSVSFDTYLHASELKFSHHAEVRMKQRGIDLKPEQLSRIADMLSQAEAKGAKDSLVLYRDIAMIVNVPSKTVVTAMDHKSLEGNIFTQIDSAVVLS
ncbi:flagellar biosynthesis protein [Paenibacillus sambharensis]|uniref:Flagellar biosynthesis protein n=1 Tax=Paenibacillus sambharensis TaxID=1803190 RepID=A0A2W1L052_9BACL|nr:TIGR02530 family flagellar biosynthesis protein [Paenibacillus sambharensis]PZD93328.1 flagellar biosynthesis protein [Paenibacillus sambharensis]